MSVELLGLSQVDLPITENQSIKALRVVISGAFSSAAEYKNLIYEVLYDGRANGAVISVPQRRNYNFAPDGTAYDMLDGYTLDNNTSLGDSNGFHFTYGKYSANISGGSHVWGVYANNTAIYYKTTKICACQIGGFAGYSNAVSTCPILIFTDPYYNLYQINSNNVSIPIVMAYTTVPWDITSPFFPTCTWRNTYWNNSMLDNYFPNSMSISSLPSLSPENIKEAIKNEKPISGDIDDPYGPGGYSEPDPGDVGTYDYDGDPQPFGDPAAFKDGLDTGFYTLYAPDSTELRTLATYLWSNNFDLNTFKRLFNNPMDLFLVLGVLPVTIPKGQVKEVGIGLINTGVYMTTASTRIVSKDMGTIHVDGKTAAYLDYSPYTRCDVILPFIGVVPVDLDAIMDRYINIKYNIDVLTGACVAGINAGFSTDAMHCIGTYAGNAMRSIPLTGADYTTMLSGLVQTAGAIAAGAASGGTAGAIAGGLASASSAVVNEGKPMIQKGGALSSASGYMLGANQMRPVLIFSYPKQCLPSLQISEIGFPAYTSDKYTGSVRSLKTLGEYSGFVKVEDIHLHDITLTQPEIEELYTILKGGIIV